jgi:hypothetical protein
MPVVGGLFEHRTSLAGTSFILPFFLLAHSVSVFTVGWSVNVVGWSCLCCAGVAIVSVSSDGSLQQAHWSAGPAAATPAAAVGDGSILALVSASADASTLQVKLVSAATGEAVESAELQVPAPAYPVSGPAPTVVAAWLDASKRKDTAGGSSSGSLSGCRLLVHWSDDQLAYVEGGAVAWSREEALASTSSNLILELPTAKAVKGAVGGDDEGSSSSGSGSSKGGLLGFLQDKERLNHWVRLQLLSVYVQFKLDKDQEKDEFYQLRQALR